MNTLAYINGKIIEESSASLPVNDLSVLRGYGVFDSFRTINNFPLFLDDHLDRFFRSARGLRLAVEPDRVQLKAAIFDLLQRNNIPESIFRITLTGGESPDSYRPGKPNLVITQHPLAARPANWLTNGIRVITYEHVRELPSIKSINYLTGVYLQEKMALAGADDVLFHMNDEVSEFPRSNVFIVTRNGEVITPLRNVLNGITRMKTLVLAKKNFPAKEGIITLKDVFEAKEVFTTSTTKQIIPVVRVDDRVIGDGNPGRITRMLDNELQQECNNHINMLLKTAYQ